MFFYKPLVYRKKFARTTTIHSGIFRGWADSVSPRMNTIASRDQLKPIGLGENFVVNYNPNAVPAVVDKLRAAFCVYEVFVKTI